MQIVTDSHNNTKLDAIAALLEELRADGVQIAPELTAQGLLQEEEAGGVLDLATGKIAGTEDERYTITEKGLHALTNL